MPRAEPSAAANRGRRCAASVWLIVSLLGPALGCEPPSYGYPPEAPLWRDPDRRPFEAQLEPFFSPHDWDRIEKTLVRPVLDALAVELPGPARNVNAMDEVADSSWFENRVGRFGMSVAEAREGPCRDAPAPERGPWRVVSAKPDGATPGFVFEAPGGQRYLAKVDGSSGSPRLSIADVLGSRLFHAAGYRVPCNAIAYFDAAMLVLDPGAHAENALGEPVPLTRAHLDGILERALRRADGRYRSLVSRYLEGRPLGPWRYHGLRAGDRNDIVPHEDRRELRGARLLAAWTDHVDQREGNTLAMWRDAGGGRGYVLHHLLDFGDCFGSIWAGPAQEAWRRGHDYWLAPGTLLADWLTLGAIERPWDRATLGPTGLTLGYFDVDSFDPERWRPRYPNPAFSRMTEEDGAWMARIIARLEPELVLAMLDASDPPPALRAELARILLGRRRKLLERYLARASPLADPSLTAERGRTWLCAVDLAVRAGVAAPQPYRARYSSPGARAEPELAVRPRSPAELCVLLPELGPLALGRAHHVRVELATPRVPRPIRFHLYAYGSGRWQLAGIER